MNLRCHLKFISYNSSPMVKLIFDNIILDKIVYMNYYINQNKYKEVVL